MLTSDSVSYPQYMHVSHCACYSHCSHLYHVPCHSGFLLFVARSAFPSLPHKTRYHSLSPYRPRPRWTHFRSPLHQTCLQRPPGTCSHLLLRCWEQEAGLPCSGLHLGTRTPLQRHQCRRCERPSTSTGVVWGVSANAWAAPKRCACRRWLSLDGTCVL